MGVTEEDLLLHYVFAGLWADAVDLFRTEPAAPDFFATRPPSIPDMGSYGTPAYLGAVFRATAAARTVAPARAEIEFLHAWAAFHLDPDTTTLDLRRDWYLPLLIDSDDATVLDGLDYAVRLAPDDPLFAEAQRLFADLHAVTCPRHNAAGPTVQPCRGLRRPGRLFDNGAPIARTQSKWTESSPRQR